MSEESVEITRADAQSAGNPPVTAGIIPADAQSVESIRIHTEFITLQSLLKLVGAVDTGGEAKIRIQNGEAKVNGGACFQRGKKLRPGDTVTFHGKSYAVGHGQ